MVWSLLGLWIGEQYRPFSNGLQLGGIVTLVASVVTPNYQGFTENARGLTECGLAGSFPDCQA